MSSIILIEPISLGETLTFTASIILLIITWKSVINARKANEITEQSLKLQSNQFSISIKPDLIFEIPPIKYSEEKNNKMEIRSHINPDHNYCVRTISSNICYDVSVTTFIYMPDKGWDQYYFFLKNELDIIKDRPVITSQNIIHSLHSENEVKCTIPSDYIRLNIIAYDGTITIPKLYVFLKYKDKIKKHYEECFELRQTFNYIGKTKHSNQIEISFIPISVDSLETKEILYKQKTKLENEFPDKQKLFYYNL